MKHTRGPWRLCNDGKCKCGQIWSDDYPVAKVTNGKWGDSYPAIRLTRGSIERQYEAYIDMIEYGEVQDNVAQANARLIAAAPDLLAALVACRLEINNTANDNHDVVELWDLVHLADVAIAKATGDDDWLKHCATNETNKLDQKGEQK